MRQELFTHHNRSHGPQLRVTRDITQRILFSPTLLNVELYCMVHHWISLTVDDKSATREGLGMSLECCMVVFMQMTALSYQGIQNGFEVISMLSSDSLEGSESWKML